MVAANFYTGIPSLRLYIYTYSPSILVRIKRIFFVSSQKTSHTVPFSSWINWHLPGMTGVVFNTQSVFSVSTSPAKLIAGSDRQITSSNVFITFSPDHHMAVCWYPRKVDYLRNLLWWVVLKKGMPGSVKSDWHLYEIVYIVTTAFTTREPVMSVGFFRLPALNHFLYSPSTPLECSLVVHDRLSSGSSSWWLHGSFLYEPDRSQSWLATLVKAISPHSGGLW